MNRKIYLLSHFFVILLLLQLLFFYNNNSLEYIEFLKIQVILVYIIIVCLSKKLYTNWEHPYIVLLGTFFLFSLSRIFLDLMGIWDLSVSDKFRNYTFKPLILKKTLEILLEFLISYFYGGVIYKVYFFNKKNCSIKNTKSLLKEKCGKILFFLGILGSFSSKFKELIYVRKYGYLSIYKGGILIIEKNLFEKIGITFLLLGYILILISGISEKKFKIYTFLFLGIYFLDSLKGGRGNFLAMLLTVIILKAYLYPRKKISIKNIVFLSGFSVLFGYIVNLYRSGYEILKFDLIKICSEFLRDQGISLLVLMQFLDFSNEVKNNGIPFLLAPIADFFLSIKYKEIYSIGQSEEYIKIVKGIGSQLSYVLNKELYLKGQGVGGNFLAEFYEFCGLKDLAVILLSILLGIFIPFLFEKLKKTKIGIILLFLNLGFIIYIPRSSIFRLDYSLTIRIILLYYTYLLFEKMLKKE